MPDRPVWMDRLPEILHELSQVPENQEVHAKDVAELLGVKMRSAQTLMSVAGARLDGTVYVIAVGMFRRYLLSKAPPGFEAEERKRRRKLASVLSSSQTFVSEHRGGGREIGPWNDLRSARRYGLGALPGTIELGPGYIMVRFDRLESGLADLSKLAVAATVEGAFEELEQRTAPVRSEEIVAPAAEDVRLSLKQEIEGALVPATPEEIERIFGTEAGGSGKASAA